MADLDQTEMEMNKMFLELNDLEEMIKGNKDLKEMEKLMGATNEVISAHKNQYESLKTNIMSINEEAEEAIQALDFYGGDAAKEATKGNDKLDSKLKELLRIEEERNEDDEAEVERRGKVSQEGQKRQIFEQLDDMASSMRSFTTDIESRLDKIYKQGASKKFGFSDIVEESSKEVINSKEKPSEKDKNIGKIAS